MWKWKDTNLLISPCLQSRVGKLQDIIFLYFSCLQSMNGLIVTLAPVHYLTISVGLSIWPDSIRVCQQVWCCWLNNFGFHCQSYIRDQSEEAQDIWYWWFDLILDSKSNSNYNIILGFQDNFHAIKISFNLEFFCQYLCLKLHEKLILAWRLQSNSFWETLCKIMFTEYNLGHESYLMQYLQTFNFKILLNVIL